MFEHLDEFVIFGIALALFCAAIEIGFRLGRRHRARHDEAARKHVGSIQTALLGLLALLLGFNLVMASTRFESRKAVVQEEVNAIGTAYLRAQLLPQPQREEFTALLKTYLARRIDYIAAGTDEAQLEATDAATSRAESQLWQQATNAAAQPPGGSALGLLIQSLNETVNTRWKRYNVFSNRVPEPVIMLLLVIASSAIGFIAFSYGLVGGRLHGSTFIFATLIALVLAAILDLDRPRGGLIRVSEEGMLRLQASFDRPLE